MSTNKEDLLDIAAQAEQDLNSTALKEGTTKGSSLSTEESGIDQSVTKKFPGSTAEYGSHVSGAGDNRDIPESEGGDVVKGSGRLTKAGDFDQGGPGEGPEHIARRRQEAEGGEDDIRGNVKMDQGRMQDNA